MGVTAAIGAPLPAADLPQQIGLAPFPLILGVTRDDGITGMVETPKQGTTRRRFECRVTDLTHSAARRLLSDFGEAGRGLDFGGAAFGEALLFGRLGVSCCAALALAVELARGLACWDGSRDELLWTGQVLGDAAEAIFNFGDRVAFFTGRVGVFSTSVSSGGCGLMSRVEDSWGFDRGRRFLAIWECRLPPGGEGCSPTPIFCMAWLSALSAV